MTVKMMGKSIKREKGRKMKMNSFDYTDFFNKNYFYENP